MRDGDTVNIGVLLEGHQRRRECQHHKLYVLRCTQIHTNILYAFLGCKSTGVSLEDVSMQLALPKGWTANLSDAKLSIGKIQHIPSHSASSQPPVITHFLCIEPDFTWAVHVHGQKVCRETCDVLKSLLAVLYPNSVNALVSSLEAYRVCPGNPDEQFLQQILE